MTISRSTLRDRYHAGADFATMLASVRTNASLWEAIWRRAEVAEELVQRVRSLGDRWHLLVLSEDWCGDAVNTVPYVARLARLAGNTELRVVGRDTNPDLMDTHLTGLSRSIPVVMVLDGEFRERGWWGPRPGELQRWVLGPGRALDKDARYREIRRWYARDRGSSTLREVVTLLERSAALRADASALLPD